MSEAIDEMLRRLEWREQFYDRAVVVKRISDREYVECLVGVREYRAVLLKLKRRMV